MTTTAAAIRDAMISMTEDITPSAYTSDKFRVYREQLPFREWAEAHPNECLRRFSIRYTGSFTPSAVSNIAVEETSDTFEIVVAYPSNSTRFGPKAQTSLDDTIAADQLKIHATIGPPGYASLTATATVLHETNWEREVSGPVTFAVVRYRVDYYRATGVTTTTTTETVYDVPQVIGLAGTALAEGTTVTGAENLRGMYLTNGRIKVTYEAKTPDSEMAAHTLYVFNELGDAVKVMTSQYGDWSYYVVGFSRPADSAVVRLVSDDAIEVDFQWDNWDVSSYNSGGPYLLTPAGQLVYPENSSTARKIATITRLVKTLRLERGAMGYFIGWHADPRCSVSNASLPTLNYYEGFGERELGTGGETCVAFSSAGNISRHPAWGAKAEWTAAGSPSNRKAWMGIDDPFESPWNTASYIATQHAGFPHDQTTGPWWVGDIWSQSDTVPYVKYICLRTRFEIGVWQFGATGKGNIVCHYVNEPHSDAGIPYRHQVYIGALYYVADSSSAYINEPSSQLQTDIAALASALVWPES